MFNALEWVLLGGLSGVAAVASVHAWRERISYGFYRFIGFELLVLLIVANVSRWFREPLAPRQLASWALLSFATALAAHGVWLLRVVGRARRRVMEDTQTVVEVGAYRYIRHPLYLALILLAWGVTLKGVGWWSGILAALATGFLAATARSEERFNLEQFGARYAEYMSRTKMFVPFLL